LPSDLRKPLLGRQKKSAGINRRFSVIMVLAALAVLSIGGLSVYTALSPGNLQRTATGPDLELQPAQNKAEPSVPAEEAETAGLQPESGRSGANINRATMPDGNVVSVYSPRPRDNDGPVLMSGQTYGQDPRMATRPNEELLEDTAFGRLPVVGADGLRPMEQYARPWSGARGTRVAIVVGGLGLSQTGSQKAIRELPPEVTLGFAASGNSLQRWMQEARREGHEILLQIPLEPFGYPGPHQAFGVQNHHPRTGTIGQIFCFDCHGFPALSERHKGAEMAAGKVYCPAGSETRAETPTISIPRPAASRDHREIAAMLSSKAEATPIA
jgi:uncharacterized protein